MPNSNPILGGLITSVVFDEQLVNGAAQLLDPTVEFTDDDGNFNGGDLIVSGLLPEDSVGIRNEGTGAGQIAVTGGNDIRFGNVVIGSFTGGTAGTPLLVSFNASATSAAIDALIQNLTYANSSDTPTAIRNLVISIHDAAGAAAIHATSFTEQTGAANPFNGVNVAEGAPSFGDLDGDGDLDAVIGNVDGTLRYWRNNGTVLAPVLQEQTGAANPFNGVDVGLASKPSFADLDGDRDLDLVIGADDGTLRFWRNTGTALAPAFTQQTGAANPFNGVVPRLYSAPSFADLDGDGDLDLVMGDSAGALVYYRNTGTALAPVFTAQTGAADPFNGVDVGFLSTPSFADLDGDGDLDAVIGESDGTLNYYRNTGTALAPVFTGKTGSANPFNGVDVGAHSIPSFADLDGDGDLDAVIGELDSPPGGAQQYSDFFGVLNYYRNTTPTAPTLSFTAVTGAANPFTGVDVGFDSKPSFADLDGDGDLDAVIGESDGTLNYYRNTGTALAPVFTAVTGAANPFNGVDVGDYTTPSTPSFADLDGDGDLDAVIGEGDGTLNYYRNTGTALAPAFTEQTGAANPFNGVNVGFYSAPSFADLDGDGDLDAMIGEYDGVLNYYRNDGTALAPVFTEQTGAANPFNGTNVGSICTPSFADLDGDGDLDALIGENFGILNYWRNIGTALAPVFSNQRGAANPFDGVDVGFDSAPTFADLDGDGDLDALIGDSGGTLNFYRNTTPTAPTPAFAEQTGAANPFNGVRVGINGRTSTPSFADLDGDGDLDAVIGENDGFLSYYRNTGTALAPTFANQTGGNNPFNGVDVGGSSAPSFADLDGDGDLDAVIGEFDGTLNYYRNTGTARTPVFAEQVGAANPFTGVDVRFNSAPTFADLDGDGDLDAVIGNIDGTLFYYRNTGTAVVPAFTVQTGTNNPFTVVNTNAGSYSTPTFADLDGDGDLDLVIGDSAGTLFYYLNNGTALAPVFVRQTGAANPFNGVDLFRYSAPSFADLDGDGDLDLVIGEYDGVFKYYRNTGSANVFVLAVTVTAQNEERPFTTGNDVVNLNTLLTSGSYYLPDVTNALDGNDTVTLSNTVNVGVAFNGGGGNDTLTGGSDRDFIFGGAGLDSIFGGSGNDCLYGEDGNDTLDGGSDNDLILGGAGLDSILGGSGNDSLYGEDGNDTLDGGSDNDFFDGGAGADSMIGGGGVDTLSYALATSGAGILFYMLAANLNGGDAAGDIYSLFENVNGTGVNDRIYMDNSDNSVEGGGGFDTVELYAGNDSYLGGSGFDYVLAGAGNDVINVGDGGSLIYGEGDDDSITATSGSNNLNGGLGNDTLTGGTGQDVILGGAGLDSILGGSGDDFLFGEDGNDTVLGEGGNDQIQGGNGIDSLSGGANVDVILGGADADSIDGGSEDDFLFGEDGNDTVLGGAGNDQVFGGSDNDSLVGNAGVDILDGGDGNDTLNDGGTLELTFSIGGNGNDTIIGTNGQDQMWGGTGTIDTGADVFQFGADNGYDIIFDFQAGAGVVDQIRLLGTGITSFAQLEDENRIGQAGANTQINLPGSDNVIFLMNTVATTLVADDFLFA
jgi:Ca2+-binding RTX toxin-like protein